MKTQTLNKKRFFMGGVIVLVAALLLAVVVPWITNASADVSAENGDVAFEETVGISIDENNATEGIEETVEAKESTTTESAESNIQKEEKTATETTVKETTVVTEDNNGENKEYKEPTIETSSPKTAGPSVIVTITGTYDTDSDLIANSGKVIIAKDESVIKTGAITNTYEGTYTWTENCNLSAIGTYDVTVSFDYKEPSSITPETMLGFATFKVTNDRPSPAGGFVATVDLNGGTVNPEGAERLKFNQWNDNGDGTWSRNFGSGATYEVVLNIWNSDQISVTKNGQIRTGWSPAADSTPLTQDTTFKALYGDEGRGDVIDDEGSNSNLAQTGDTMAFALIALSLVVASSVVVLTRRHNKANH